MLGAQPLAVLGGGAWGTALAKLLADKGHTVRLWCRRTAHAEAIERQRENIQYLPGAPLPSSLRATADLRDAVQDAAVVVFAAPSHATREVAREARAHLPHDALLVSATKGIENETLRFMDEVLCEEIPAARARLAMLSGPSFARELAAELPTGVVIAAHDERLREALMTLFHTPFLRTYGSADVIGVECGGALKNVIAIAAGAADGLGLGYNTRAMLITRGLAETARLALARGGQPLTLAGLAGMGDLVLTCTGELSRNRRVGLELGRGRKLPEILAELGHVAEGVNTARSVHDLGRRLGIELPICEQAYAVLFEEKPAKHALRELMDRALGLEFH